MSAFIKNQRALKGLAPTAGMYNKLAYDLELLKSRLSPIYCLLALSGNKTITFDSVLAHLIADFATVTAQTASPFTLFSGGVITIPKGFSFAREVVSVFLNGTPTTEVIIGGSMVDANALTNQTMVSFGTGGTTATVVSAVVDSGWCPVVEGQSWTPAARFDGDLGQPSIQVNSSVITWYSLEVI